MIPEPLVILHKPKFRNGRRVFYHEFCSTQGIRRAHELGASGIDIDIRRTRDGVWVACHWNRPMLRDGFRDPLGKLSRFSRVSRMTIEEVRRLRAGEYQIALVSAILREGNALGVLPCLEVKPDSRNNQRRPWAYLEKLTVVHGPALIMTIQRREGRVIMRMAHAAGLTTMLLSRRYVGPRWWPHLDYVKGGRARTRGKPARVKRLGTGRRNVTRWGAGCRPANVVAVVAACRRAAR